MSAVHINRPSSTRFQAMIKGRGCRKWIHCGKPLQHRGAAARVMLRAFLHNDIKRGCVAMTAEYYDPMIVMEITRP